MVGMCTSAYKVLMSTAYALAIIPSAAQPTLFTLNLALEGSNGIAKICVCCGFIKPNCTNYTTCVRLIILARHSAHSQTHTHTLIVTYTCTHIYMHTCTHIHQCLQPTICTISQNICVNFLPKISDE